MGEFYALPEAVRKGFSKESSTFFWSHRLLHRTAGYLHRFDALSTCKLHCLWRTDGTLSETAEHPVGVLEGLPYGAGMLDGSGTVAVQAQ